MWFVLLNWVWSGLNLFNELFFILFNVINSILFWVLWVILKVGLFFGFGIVNIDLVNVGCFVCVWV